VRTTDSGFFTTLGTRVRAAGVHLLLSATVVAALAVLVFGIWYPDDYRKLAGGTDLFLIVTIVDVVIGPLLTFVVFDRSKGLPHLRRDLAVIAVLQVLALSYGMNAVYMGRPVALAFEYDRFRVVSFAEVVDAELPQALPMFQSLPMGGPMLLAVRKSNTPQERADALNASVLLGVDNSQRPKFWIPYDENARRQAVTIGRPLEVLFTKYPDSKNSFIQTQDAIGRQDEMSEMRFLPVRAKLDAVALLKRNGDIAGFLPYDGFF
jgi:hypothetical protein